MGKKPDDRPYKPEFEKVNLPAEPLAVRAVKREAQREAIRRTSLSRGLAEAWGKAKDDLVMRFIETGHIEMMAPERPVKPPRPVKNSKGEDVPSTEVALWVFDLHLHGITGLMEAYRETARHYDLTAKQVMDCFKDHRGELERHRPLFTMQ